MSLIFIFAGIFAVVIGVSALWGVGLRFTQRFVGNRMGLGSAVATWMAFVLCSGALLWVWYLNEAKEIARLEASASPGSLTFFPALSPLSACVLAVFGIVALYDLFRLQKQAMKKD